MHATELDSLVGKFHQLWKAGFTAHLDLDTHAGNAWIGLRVQLGPAPPGRSHHPHQDVSPRRYRGPSYRRRLEKRRAARFEASPSSIPTAEVGDGQPITENLEAAKATIEHHVEDLAEKVKEKEKSTENSEIVGDTNDRNNQELNVAEKANLPEYFECPICDFTSTWNNGLKVHMSRVHSKLEQIDGSVDSIVTKHDSVYENTAHYWERGRIGLAYHSFLNANSIIDNCEDISNEEKAEEKAKLLEARKYVFGNNYRNYPPWKVP